MTIEQEDRIREKKDEKGKRKERSDTKNIVYICICICILCINERCVLVLVTNYRLRIATTE